MLGDGGWVRLRVQGDRGLGTTADGDRERIGGTPSCWATADAHDRGFRATVGLGQPRMEIVKGLMGHLCDGRLRMRVTTGSR